MLKKNKWKVLFTTLVILLVPVFTGCLLWQKLPDSIAIHFNAGNVADGWGSKPVVVFVFPLVLAALHVICLAVTSVDPKYHNIGKKPAEIIFWIVPGIVLFMYAAVYANAFHAKVDFMFLAEVFVGVLLVVLGNVLPKTGQNYSFGVKLPWTLEDGENWNRTNRLAGWCMVLSGIVIVAASFWHCVWILIPAGLVSVLLPTAYSYLLFCRKSGRDGK